MKSKHLMNVSNIAEDKDEDKKIKFNQQSFKNHFLKNLRFKKITRNNDLVKLLKFHY